MRQMKFSDAYNYLKETIDELHKDNYGDALHQKLNILNSNIKVGVMWIGNSVIGSCDITEKSRCFVYPSDLALDHLYNDELPIRIFIESNTLSSEAKLTLDTLIHAKLAHVNHLCELAGYPIERAELIEVIED